MGASKGGEIQPSSGGPRGDFGDPAFDAARNGSFLGGLPPSAYNVLNSMPITHDFGPARPRPYYEPQQMQYAPQQMQYAPQPMQYAPPQMFADPNALNDSTVNAALSVLNRAPISRPMPAMRGSGAVAAGQGPYEDYLRTWGNIAPEVTTATQVNQTPTYSGGESNSFDGGDGMGNVSNAPSNFDSFLNTPIGMATAVTVNAVSPGEARGAPAPVVNMETPYNFNTPTVPSVPAAVVSSSTSPGSGVGGGYNAGDGGYGSGEVGYDAGDMGHGDGGGAGAGGYDAGDGGYGSGEGGYDAGDMGHGDGGGGGGGGEAASGASIGAAPGDGISMGVDAGLGGAGGPGKIICTAMNHAYGFGSFRNAIWIKYSDKHLTKAHEVGYHTLFLPLVDFGFKRGDGRVNLVVRKVLEWGTRHRSTDLRAELRNKKRDTTGRIIRLIFEPLCYAVGKLKGY